MAEEYDGFTPLKFGTATVSGWVVTSSSENESGTDIEIPDEIGDVTSHISNIGKRTEVSLELVAKTGTSLPVVGGLFAYTNAAGTSKTIRILTVGNARTAGQAMATTITGKLFPGFTAS